MPSITRIIAAVDRTHPDNPSRTVGRTRMLFCADDQWHHLRSEDFLRERSDATPAGAPLPSFGSLLRACHEDPNLFFDPETNMLHASGDSWAFSRVNRLPSAEVAAGILRVMEGDFKLVVGDVEDITIAAFPPSPSVVADTPSHLKGGRQ